MTLRSYNHDFARLAKQSGYYFQLHRGKVNWTEIQNLNVEEIVENGNFELLEHNLINVINCNLEREYDFKVLDQNFVKLFKLAQLGVDYLSYCQLYLDKCVVLLQEQLTASQEKCKNLSKENLKKNEELQEAKSRVMTRNYQCEKCDKVFISEVYLKCHDKRRHSDLNTPKSGKTTKNFVDKCQQTDEQKKKLTKSVQTFPSQNDTQESKDISKQENYLKIENMEKELDDLKSRLKKAENTLIEKTEISSSISQHNLNFPSPMYYPPMLPFIPTYLPQPYIEINSGHQKSTPEYKQSCSSIVPESVVTEPVSSNKSFFSYPSSEKEKDFIVTSQKDVSKEKEIKTIETVSGKIVECENKTTNLRKDYINNKENIDPNEVISDVSSTKPRPFPRKIKKMFETSVQDKTIVEANDVVNSNIYLESHTVNFSSESIPRSSTPKIEQPEGEVTDFETSKETLTTEREINLNESSVSTVVTEAKPKSFIKKIVTRNSPKLQELSKNLKRSLTNLCDSVSSSGKDMGKPKEVNSSNSKTNTIDALNNHLRELGIDPEWSGIPKKTMKEKLKTLKFQRKVLTKENPMYPNVRKKLEKSILQKLNENLINLRMKKSVPTSNEQESIETQSSDVIKVFDTDNSSLMGEQKSETEFKFRKPVMYNVETSSDTDVSDIETTQKPDQKMRVEKEIDFSTDLEELGAEKPEEKFKDFNFSIFQVDKENNSKLEMEKKVFPNETDELDTDSDFDEEFLKKFETGSLKTSVGYFNDSTKAEQSINELGVISKDQLNFIGSEQDKTDNQSILKSSQKFHSPSSFTPKKKVLFADHIENSDMIKEHQSKKKKDDIWSSESDWDEDMG